MKGLQQRFPTALDEKEQFSSPKKKMATEKEATAWRASVVLPILCLLLLLQLWQITMQSSNQRLLQEIHTGGVSGTGSTADGQQVLRSTASTGPASKCDCRETTYTPPEFNLCEVAIVGGRKRDGYGSWPLCLNHVPANAIVYSFGIGLDTSFDAAMMSKGAKVYGFDPTIKPEIIPTLFGPRDKEFMSRFVFTQIGLGSSNGVTTFFKSAQKGIQSMTAISMGGTSRKYEDVGFQAAVLTLPTIMAAMGHNHVDLLKVDVEGIEFMVCETPAFLDSLSKVGQVIYEFHERLIKNPGNQKLLCVDRLRKRGFTLVNKTESEEYVFARVTKDAQVVHLP